MTQAQIEHAARSAAILAQADAHIDGMKRDYRAALVAHNWASGYVSPALREMREELDPTASTWNGIAPIAFRITL